ncbi:2-dehydro-3-deoxy-6-phosphogalactonate aldolase [Limnohabitans sp. 103DPR2]|uniref:2-dehydro-3-deoxy-6-phosphogalactonate aldolase n=1 Tax=Limnohabitans sp. 103DPR2 TaxID=1678129 RepID=UPI0006DD0363|nr:2-dehydro-3-deoxy-6-phosphogalactonate aldolase [Limnohabitans sp. 103DPR2]ALK91708.1 2-dehydro-3-deoxy-6-phosphogalactonate aldolase [Limnohabitans sp. 103DPR2]
MTPLLAQFHAHMDKLPLVAILRGLKPEEALDVGRAIVNAGFHILEVPLNSPDPLKSIQILADAFPNALVGAGTVTTAQQVRDIKAAGGQLIISPHLDDNVVCEAVNLGLISLPGVATPSEAFKAIALGAHGLKLFPAEMISPAVVKSMRAVLPCHIRLVPVGGIGTHNMADYRKSGASGFGIGSALYAPGKSAQAVGESAAAFVKAWQAPA